MDYAQLRLCPTWIPLERAEVFETCTICSKNGYLYQNLDTFDPKKKNLAIVTVSYTNLSTRYMCTRQAMNTFINA